MTLISLVSALALYGALDQLGATRRLADEYQDPYAIDVQVARLEGARAILGSEKVVGYISDAPQSTRGGQAVFLASSYALAPTQLVRFPARHPLTYVLGNFTQPKVDLASFEANGLSMEKDLGQGVVIFRTIRR
ncbi:MAG TPA: hypothetical protein VE621_02405 [Bryobacteraceae bacterium]|nr:hypothetical protein [Bryobacteraceae bacterium]